MPNYVVQYAYHADHAARRDEHRPAHRRWLADGHEAGTILLVGPYSDGSGALLLVHADDERAVAEFLAHDPFALAGAIDATLVKEWRGLYGPVAD